MVRLDRFQSRIQTSSYCRLVLYHMFLYSFPSGLVRRDQEKDVRKKNSWTKINNLFSCFSLSSFFLEENSLRNRGPENYSLTGECFPQDSYFLWNSLNQAQGLWVMKKTRRQEDKGRDYRRMDSWRLSSIGHSIAHELVSDRFPDTWPIHWQSIPTWERRRRGLIGQWSRSREKESGNRQAYNHMLCSVYKSLMKVNMKREVRSGIRKENHKVSNQ